MQANGFDDVLLQPQLHFSIFSFSSETDPPGIIARVQSHARICC